MTGCAAAAGEEECVGTCASGRGAGGETGGTAGTCRDPIGWHEEEREEREVYAETDQVRCGCERRRVWSRG